MKILLTSTSFQDSPGKHQELLKSCDFQIDTLRGPVKESVILEIIENYDGIICGDDEITENVIKRGSEGRLKIISKYGVGLDKIDLEAAKKYKVPVTNCPGVNHVTVAEHVIALLMTFYKNIHLEYNITKKGGWKRLVGHEVYGKKIGILGLGKIGKEVAIRAKALGLIVYVYDKFIDQDFVKVHDIKIKKNVTELLKVSEIVSLNVPLNAETEGIISLNEIKNNINKGTVIINTARGKLVDLDSIVYGIENGILGGYITDVLEEEPMISNHPLLKYDNVLITPHIGSRTYQSIERQGLMAVENLLKYL